MRHIPSPDTSMTEEEATQKSDANLDWHQAKRVSKDPDDMAYCAELDRLYAQEERKRQIRINNQGK